MATRRTQPFAGAVSASYEPLRADVVRWQREQLRQMPCASMPSGSAWR
jgi:hypothetical protein